MRERVEALLYPTIVLVVVVGLWEGASRAGWVAPYILPAPSAILVKLWTLRDVFLEHTWATTLEIVLGFLVALVTGIVLAVCVTYVKPFERAFYPWIIATQAVPKVALGPLFIIWLGFGILPKIVIGALIAFFPIMIASMVTGTPDAEDLKKFYNALKRAQRDIDLRPEKYTHYYRNEFPDRYHPLMDTRRWGPGERIVFEPYTEEVFAQSREWIAAREIFDTGKAPLATDSYDAAVLRVT